MTTLFESSRNVPQAATSACYLVGSESLLIQCAEILLARRHEILGVISSDPAIAEWAQSRGLRYLNLNAELLTILREQPFDYLFSITNLKVLSPEVVGTPGRMAINFHDGPLPGYAGLHATTWALMADEREYAITWHRMAARVDEGDVLIEEPVEISPGDTALTLNAKCYEAGMRSFGRLLDDLQSDRLVARQQDSSRRRFFERTRRPHGAGSIDWDASAASIAGLTRALDFGHTPNPLTLPKAWLAGKVLTLGRGDLLAGANGAQPGTIVEARPGRLVVATGTAHVAFGTVCDADGLHFDAVVSGAGVRLVPPPCADLARLTALHQEIAEHEPFWVGRLSRAKPIDAPGGDVNAGAEAKALSMAAPVGCRPPGATPSALRVGLSGRRHDRGGHDVPCEGDAHRRPGTRVHRARAR